MISHVKLINEFKMVFITKVSIEKCYLALDNCKKLIHYD